MDKREAKRQAHRWVSGVIEGALGNGAAEVLAENDADVERIRAAIKEIGREHYRLGEPR
jgi:hypothetical protein